MCVIVFILSYHMMPCHIIGVKNNNNLSHSEIHNNTSIVTKDLDDLTELENTKNITQDMNDNNHHSHDNDDDRNRKVPDLDHDQCNNTDHDNKNTDTDEEENISSGINQIHSNDNSNNTHHC